MSYMSSVTCSLCTVTAIVDNHEGKLLVNYHVFNHLKFQLLYIKTHIWDDNGFGWQQLIKHIPSVLKSESHKPIPSDKPRSDQRHAAGLKCCIKIKIKTAWDPSWTNGWELEGLTFFQIPILSQSSVDRVLKICPINVSLGWFPKCMIVGSCSPKHKARSQGYTMGKVIHIMHVNLVSIDLGRIGVPKICFVSPTGQVSAPKDTHSKHPDSEDMGIPTSSKTKVGLRYAEPKNSKLGLYESVDGFVFHI